MRGSARVTHAADPKGVSGEVPGGLGVIILQLRRVGKQLAWRDLGVGVRAPEQRD